MENLKIVHYFSGFAISAILATAALPAMAGSTIYDMSVFLGDGADVANAGKPTGAADSAREPQIAASHSAMTPAATGDLTKVGTRRSDLSRADSFLSEIRVGLMAHDVGPFTVQTQREEGSVDLNAEFIFHSPDFLEVIGSPRPHLGTSINTAGDTSQLYGGLSYEWYLAGNFFAGLHGGGAVHNGETTNVSPNKKNLGCTTLFRGAVEVGYRFDDHHGVSLMLDHISNAYLCDTNEGLETVGLRYGYRF